MKSFLENFYCLDKVDFDGIVRSAAETMPPKDWKLAWQKLGHGVVILKDEPLLNAYLVAYGEMHRAKLKKVLDGAFHANDFNQFAKTGVSIIDWGCGQGLATAVLLDYFKNFKSRVLIRCVRLLEVSDDARNRAAQIISAYDECHNADLRALPWSGDQSIRIEDFHLPHDMPIVHLFSNILDVAEVDIEIIANTLDRLREYGPSTVIACGPQNNAGVVRIPAFYRMMKDDEPLKPTFGTIEFKNSYSQKHSCTYFGLSFQLPPTAFPLPKIEQRQMYRLGASADAVFGICPSNWFHYELSSYENGLILRFVQNRVPPYLAVLNNMVARGWPSRAGLLVEQTLVRELKLTERSDTALGVLSFRFKDCTASNDMARQVADKIGACEFRPHFDEREQAFEKLLTVPLLVSRVQHATLRGAMARLFDIDKEVVRVLAVERDIECVELALAELEDMFEHLSALSRTEDNVPHPQFEVRVVRSGETPTFEENEKFDVLLDVSFYRHITDTTDYFERLNGRFDFGARICTAEVKVSETVQEDVGENDSVQFQICTGCNIVYRDVCQRLSDGTYEPTETARHLQYFLQNVFRKSDFRPGQLPILNRALQNRSVIGLLPTGGGKSLTYQLAGMMQPGIVLVVDPLRSLMKNQVDGLKQNGITACVYINSSLTSKERKDAEAMSISGNCKFIFISPERLSIPGYRYALQEMYDNALYFSYGVVDEVHCVSEWGHDFRFNYLHLGRNLHMYVRCRPNPNISDEQYVPLFGLTATASFDVLADVERDLSGLNSYTLDSEAVVRYENTNRLELQYRIVKVPVNAEVSNRRVVFCASEKRYKGNLREYNEARKKGEKRANGLKILCKNGRKELDTRYVSYKMAVQDCKRDFISEILKSQKEYFSELLNPDAIKTMKARFLDRESIKSESPIAKQIDERELQVDFNETSWRASPYEGAGIVFCPHKGFKADKKKSTPISVEGVCESLRNEYGEEVVRYFTGGGDAGDKGFDVTCQKNMDDFISNKAGLMVATKAFGLGIDKPNVRFVVNMNHPSSLESFVQEAGRAGRDRKMALATILLSEDDTVDMDVVEFFHKQAFIGDDAETQWLNKLFAEVDMNVEGAAVKDATEPVKGFLRKLYGMNVGERMVVTIPFQPTEKDLNGKWMEVQVVVDKLIYRFCCIGVVEDVECIYKDGGTRDLRVRLAHLDDEEYFAALRQFLERYFSRERAEKEVERARQYEGENAIHKCVGYLTKFVYDNIQRKRRQAMEDMHRFCMDGVRAEENGKSWLDVNEDLKDTIYYYFNSKYARVGYEVNGEPYSLLEDMKPENEGKMSDLEMLKKYMRVVDDEFSDGNSPKDNAKHLQGAVRLISRGLIETNPVLSLLNVFCMGFLGLDKTPEQREELRRNVVEDGLLCLFERKKEAVGDFWTFFAWARERLVEVSDGDKDFLDSLFDLARMEIHLECVEQVVQHMSV